MGGGGGPVIVKLDKNGFNPKGTKFFATLSSIIKAFWGAGTLALPLLFKDGGAASTTFFLWFLAGIALYAIFCLAEAADLIMLTEARQNMVTRVTRAKFGPNAPRAQPFEVLPGYTDADLTPEDRSIAAPTFSEVGNVAMGRWGGFLVDCALSICQLGICIAYVIFISTNLFEALGGVSRLAYVFIIIGPIALFLLISDLSRLSFVGLMGNLVYLVTIGIIFYVGLKDFCCVPRAEVNWNNFAYYPTIFGTCSFALEGIALILPIKSRMYSDKQFVRSMTTGMVIVVSLYWVVGIGSYLMFGEATQSPIIKSLPPSTISNLAKVALSLSIFFSFPFQFFPITDYIDKLLGFRYKIDPESLTKTRDYIAQHDTPDTMSPSSPSSPVNILTPAPHDTDLDTYNEGQDMIGLHKTEESISAAQSYAFKTSLVIRYAILAIITFVAIVFPDFKLIIALFGSFANSSLAFIFPTLFWVCIIAQGHKHITNSPLYLKLATSPSIFQLKNVYYHDRMGHRIDVASILEKNRTLLDEFEGKNSVPVSPSLPSSPSPATSRAPSYGSFDGENSDVMPHRPPPGSPSPVATSPTSVDLYQDKEDGNEDDVRVQPYKHPNEGTSDSSPLFRQPLSLQIDSEEYTDSSITITTKDSSVSRQPIRPIPQREYVIGWIAFPLSVAFVGIIASGIGVADSIKDIIHEFS